MSWPEREQRSLGAGTPVGDAAAEARLDRITSWLSDDPMLAAACSAAIDPVEIAARLESHGVSSQVAVDAFGYADVFSTAEAVYRSVPFEDAVPPPPSIPPGGGPVDLLRGALYALPALFLPIVVAGFGLRLSWWVLPIGLTVAWGTSQAVASCAWTMQGRKDSRSDALLAWGSTVVTGLLCLAMALVATWAVGGTEASTVTVVLIGLYVAASGAMVFQESELLLALCMVPAAVGSLLSLGHLAISVSTTTAAWCVVATVVLVAVMANRFALSPTVASSRTGPGRLGPGGQVPRLRHELRHPAGHAHRFCRRDGRQCPGPVHCRVAVAADPGPHGMAAPIVSEPGHRGAQRQPRPR